MLRASNILRNDPGRRRQMVRRPLGLVLLLLSVGLLLTGCPKKPDVGQAGPTAVGPQAGVTTPRPTTPAAPAPKAPETLVGRPAAPREAAVAPARKPDAGGESPLKDIFFDFDRAIIRADQQTELAADVAWLKANAAARAVVEGHCDERGTAEYNLGLGERRAKAVRDALMAAGIEAGRIRTVSYGKERPFLLGHDESAWRVNRRAHFVKE